MTSDASVASFGPGAEGNPSQAFKAARLVRSNGDMQRSQRQAKAETTAGGGSLAATRHPQLERQPLPMLVMMPMPNEA